MDGLSLEIEAGQIFGMVGPNGAGKTSTIRVLATLLEPTYGRVRVNGHDVREATSLARRRLGYMPDLAPVHPDLRVDEFLEYFDRSFGLPAEGRRGRIERAIEAVGLVDKRRALAKHLSRGLTQRLVLAKTLLHEPTVLLLDEPASGMDPLARRELREILRTQARSGCAILVSSHILSELSDMCTHVGVMRSGRLRAVGSIESILSTEKAVSARIVHIESVVPIAEEQIQWVRQFPEVLGCECRGKSLQVEFEGNEAGVAELLRGLIGAGLSVFQCKVSQPALEDVLTRLSSEEDVT